MSQQPTKKTLTVSRGHFYTYYTQPPSATAVVGTGATSTDICPKPTILILHGWPDDASLWEEIIRDLILPAGYGVIAPDALGSGESSKPLDMREYDFRLTSQDLMEILIKEGVKKVLLWAHDWGAGFATRFYNYYPSHVLAMTLTNVNYFAPSTTPFSLDDSIKASQKAYGYGIAWYWYLFASDEGLAIISNHLDSFWTILHGNAETWLETFCKENGMKDYLLADRKEPVLPYAGEEYKKRWLEKITADNNLRLKASLLWYTAVVKGVQDEANREAAKNLVLKVPYLLVRGENDVCCRGEDHQMLKDSGIIGQESEEVVIPDAGHWVMTSHPVLYGEKVLDWFKRNGF